MRKIKIYEWETSGGKNEIESYFESKTKAEQAKYHKTKKAIEHDGLETFENLNTRQLHGKLWEIKITQNRIMYVIADIEKVYFLHACKKQKGKTEKNDLDKAIKRAKQSGLL